MLKARMTNGRRWSVSIGFARLPSPSVVGLSASLISGALGMVTFSPPGGTPAATWLVGFRRVPSDNVGWDEWELWDEWNGWIKGWGWPKGLCFSRFHLFPLCS